MHALPILSDGDIAREIDSFNDTRFTFPEGDCLAHELVERWSERTPDSVAVVFGGQQMSYRDLNAHANAVASKLLDAGVRPDSLVGVFIRGRPSKW